MREWSCEGNFDNCRSYNEVKRRIYCSTLLHQCEILFLQEHWLAVCKLHVLNNIFSTHIAHRCSGFEKNKILSGHMYDGCAIFWRANLTVKIFFVPTNNKRICCIRVCYESYKFLLINVYIPYESVLTLLMGLTLYHLTQNRDEK